MTIFERGEGRDKIEEPIFFLSKKFHNVLERMKNQFSHLQFLRYVRSQFFESCEFVPKYQQFSETDFGLILQILDFEIWMVLYSTFVVNWGHDKFRKQNYIRGVRPPKPSGSCDALPPTGGSTPRPRMLLDYIPLANWLSDITGCFSEPGLQKSLRPQLTANVRVQNRPYLKN